MWEPCGVEIETAVEEDRAGFSRNEGSWGVGALRGVAALETLGQPFVETLDACADLVRASGDKFGKVEPDLQIAYCLGAVLAREDLKGFVFVELESADSFLEKCVDCFVVDSFGRL